MAEPYRVGIVGLGRVAGSIQDEVAGYPGRILLPYSHTHAYASVPRTRVVAGADLDEARVQAYRERWEPTFGSIAGYTSFQEMLDKERLDIVSICTHAPTHAVIAIAAARAGAKAIFCEKAMAISLAEADAMIDVCEEHGTKLIIDHTRRWDPFYESALKMLQDGRLGTLKSIIGHISGSLLHTGSHMIDLMLMFAQSPVRWVEGTLADGADVGDDAAGSALLRFHNGAIGFLDAQSGPLFEVDVIGSAGRLRLNNFGEEFFTWDPATRTMVRRPLPLVTYPRSGMQGAVEEMLACIEENRSSRSDGYAGRAALEVAMAIYSSHKSSGARVPIPLAERQMVVLSR